MFIDVVTFNQLAEAVAENLEEDRQVAVTGRLDYRQCETPEGSPRSKHEIIATQVQFLAKPASNGPQPEPVYAAGEEPFWRRTARTRQPPFHQSVWWLTVRFTDVAP